MERIWWERVPNATAFISDIIDNLVNEKSIILQYDSIIPWRHEMIALIKDSVAQQNSMKRFEVIHNVDDPGAYLLKEFCKAEKRASYRPSKSFAQFFAESDDIVLHSRFLWVIIDSQEDLDAWTDFVSEYVKKRGKNKETAVFILEWAGKKPKGSKKGIRLVAFNEFINAYDHIVFAMLATSLVKDDMKIKNYLAELTSTIAGDDIELCAACLMHYQTFLQNPYSVIMKICSEDFRSNVAPFDYTETPEDVDHHIWHAQIKAIYPLIEEYREEFVAKHHDQIAKELPITSAFGDIYNDPKEVELGTLVFMADNGYLEMSSDEYFRLKRYKDARNKLSHLNVLTIEEIRELIDD